MARTIDMVRACPETQFVLDHLGKPGVRAGMVEPWRAQLTELAEFPNVVCKISGIVTEAHHTAWTADDLKLYVEHALEVFGEDRVLFGGDWPVVTLASSYRRWVETLDELTRGLSVEARRKLWADNARRVYRL
jgi:L-fuconolactonase